MPPAAKRRGPRATLVPLDSSARLVVPIDGLDEAVQEQVLALVPFVSGVRSAFARQWPAPGVEQGRPGHYTRTYPFPDCWPLHPELVTEFGPLRRWTTVIERGEVAPAAYGAEYDRWTRHVREVAVAMAREISQLCMVSGTTKHVDPAIPRPGFGRVFQSHMTGTPARATPWRTPSSAGPERPSHGGHSVG